MSKLSLFLGVCVTLSLCAHQAAAARMVAERVSVHQQVKAAGLSEMQQQYRRAAETAGADMVCRKAEVKQTINADTSVDGVTDINWDTVKKTAADGMKEIEKSIAAVTVEIDDLATKIKEIEEANTWKELGVSDMNEMLFAACADFQEEGNPTGDCSWAVEKDCGNEDERYFDSLPPFEEPIEKFMVAAEAKIQGKSRLSPTVFRDHCKSVLQWESKAPNCEWLCDEYVEIVKSLRTEESSQVLGNGDLDELKAEHKKKTKKLADLNAEKASCAQAQTAITKMREQLEKLSGNYKSATKAVGRYKRVLNLSDRRLKRQIKVLEEKRELLEEAKALFAEKTKAEAEARAEVERQQAVVDDLIKQLEEQRKLIKEIEEKISQIDEATTTARLIKTELSRILQNAHDTQLQSVHVPLEGVKITLDRKIAQEFDNAQASAAPAMKTTVQAVANYCSTAQVTNALTNPLITKKIEGSKGLNFICVGQDWNNMIAEAESTVKAATKQVVDILVAEQEDVKSDIHVPVPASAELRDANGEPKGLRHVVATFGGQGSFFDGYLNPGWTVDVTDGALGGVGKMLQLYQKLGEAAEEMQALWDEAIAHEKVLVEKKDKAITELERLTVLLNKAIEEKRQAKLAMDEAQKVYDKNLALKERMQKAFERDTERYEKGVKEVEDVKAELLKEHTERAAALLQILQELK